MQKWRRLRSIEDALADYQKFKISGFNQASLDNKLGLIILETFDKEYYPLGEAAFSCAQTANKSIKVYKANLALMKTIRGDFEAAFTLFSTVTDYVTKSSSAVYILAYAKSAIESAAKSNDKSSGLKDIVELAVKSSQKPLTNMIYNSWQKDIVAAAAGLGVLPQT